MTRLTALLFSAVLLTAAPLLRSQNFALSQFPYIPDPPRREVFNVREMMAGIEPLTLRTEPLQMPDHLIYPPEQLPWLRLLREAQTETVQGNPRAAYDKLGRFLEEFPDFAPARMQRADAAFRLGLYAEAEAIYTDLLSRHPENFQILNNLSWLYVTAGDPEFVRPQQALNLAKRAISINPGLHHAWSTLSRAHYANLQFEEAVRTIDIAMRMAQQGNEPATLLVNYLNHAEQAQRALRATSILE